LTSLPKFPNSLWFVDVTYNLLTTLNILPKIPFYPKKLEYFYTDNNKFIKKENHNRKYLYFIFYNL